MNAHAKSLIHRLRNDEHVRGHFDINSWFSNCGTIGCIAGWATMLDNWQVAPIRDGRGPAGMMPSLLSDRLVCRNGEFREVEALAAELLGLDRHIARTLFIPGAWHEMWATPEAERRDYSIYSEHEKSWTSNTRPPMETVEQMVAFTRNASVNSGITPDIAANALEGVAENHPGYTNWAEAFELEEA